MRVALKIAYDGRGFAGHQRQPDARTVEGECLRALKSARVFSDEREAFFRSASRTDRGVSAIGNVIAFESAFPPEVALGLFDDRARGVWAWAHALVPDSFHPRHAEERWYRYHIPERLPLEQLREASSLFAGEHDFRSFTSDPPRGPFAIGRIDVARRGDATVLDVRARSFRRGMVRRIVSALLAYAQGETTLEEIREVLQGARRDFGTVPAEPLVLMDVRYDIPFTLLFKPKVLDEWRRSRDDLALRSRFIEDLLARSTVDREARATRPRAPPATATADGRVAPPQAVSESSEKPSRKRA